MRAIPGFDGFYINNNGKKIKGPDGKKIKGRGSSNGYITVRLNNKSALVHRLVALAYKKNPKNKPHVHHKNSVRSDNYYKNLKWVTPSENAKLSYVLGESPSRKGKLNGRAKLDEADVIEIKALLAKGISTRSIAEIYNVSRPLIAKIKNKKRWSHIN